MEWRVQVGTAERVSRFWKEAPRVEERHLSGLLAIQFQREEIVWRGASVPAAGPVEGPESPLLGDLGGRPCVPAPGGWREGQPEKLGGEGREG